MNMKKASDCFALVVEDSGFARKVVEDMIKSFGFQTLSVEGGKQALEVISKQVPDLILLDIMMSGVDGIDVIKSLKTKKLKLR